MPLDKEEQAIGRSRHFGCAVRTFPEITGDPDGSSSRPVCLPKARVGFWITSKEERRTPHIREKAGAAVTDWIGVLDQLGTARSAIRPPERAAVNLV